MSLVVINSYNTGQFRVIRLGAMAQSKENVPGEREVTYFCIMSHLIYLNTTPSLRFTFSICESLAEDYVQLKPFYAPIGSSGFLVRNKGCRIPAMDPFDPAIQHFITKEKPFVCEHGNFPPLIESNNTALFINPLVWDEFYNRSDGISCCWRPFWRTKDQDNAITLVSLSPSFIHEHRIEIGDTNNINVTA